MIKKPIILVVDDEIRNQRLLEALLIPMGYKIILANNGKEALKKVQTYKPDLILLDIMMPQLDGFETARKLKENNETSIIPIIMITALKDVEDRVKAIEAGADDFLSKPVDKVELRARVHSLLQVKAYNDHMLNYQKELEAEVVKRTSELNKAFKKVQSASLETIYRLSRAAEYKDEDTVAHILRMSHYCSAVSSKMRQSDSFVETILYASPMHDVGKIGTPDHILLKPGKLTPDEWKIMKEHTIIGGHILEASNSEFIQLAEVIAVTHHEKWDGSGYPNGLKEKNIPIAGRITAIADVFDALTTKRPYKEPFSIEKSFKIIEEGRGQHFDPDVVDAFFSINEEILSIKEKFEIGSKISSSIWLNSIYKLDSLTESQQETIT
ncbi:MAG: two-component system response regulator, partial [Spirochaetota bacterium]|nr:two-component system response regulator [Spirochaetota bacterium]